MNCDHQKSPPPVEALAWHAAQPCSWRAVIWGFGAHSAPRQQNCGCEMRAEAEGSLNASPLHI